MKNLTLVAMDVVMKMQTFAEYRNKRIDQPGELTAREDSKQNDELFLIDKDLLD